MPYAMLCYGSEAVTSAWRKQQEGEIMAGIRTAERAFPASTTLGPVLRLFPATTATTLRAGAEPLVLVGPFAETKEQLPGLWIVDCASLEEGIEAGRHGRRARTGIGPFARQGRAPETARSLSGASRRRGPARTRGERRGHPHAERLQGYFHFFGLKGAMLRELGRTEEARFAFDQASSWRKRRRKRRISGSISTASTISARRRIV